MADTRHPKTTFNAKYPYNRATLTESGHQFEMDDTPSHERIRLAHKTGTYWEVSPDGKKSELISGDDYKYVKGGMSLTIDQHGDIKISGHARI